MATAFTGCLGQQGLLRKVVIGRLALLEENMHQQGARRHRGKSRGPDVLKGQLSHDEHG